MKVLILANEIRYTCGVTAHVYGLSQALSNLKIDFQIICGDGNRVKEFQDSGYGISNSSFLKHQNRTGFNFVRSIVYLSKVVWHYKPDIIHAHHHYHAYLARIISTVFSVKVLQTNHGIIPEVTRIPTLSGHYFVSLNPAIQKYIRDKGIKPDRLFSGKHGLVVPEYPAENNGKIKIICASRFEEGKGIETYIEAVSLLPDELKSTVRFELAGDGTLKSSLLDLINKFRAPITYCGNVPVLIEKLKTTNVFIFPSYLSTEGFPIVLIEAALTGNLIICSDYPGHETAVENGKTGLVFHGKDSAGLSEIIQQVVRNFSGYDFMRRDNYKKAAREYSMKAFEENIHSIYTAIIEHNRSNN